MKKESGVGKARESESGVRVRNSVNRLPSPEGRYFLWTRCAINQRIFFKLTNLSIKTYDAPLCEILENSTDNF